MRAYQVIEDVAVYKDADRTSKTDFRLALGTVLQGDDEHEGSVHFIETPAYHKATMQPAVVGGWVQRERYLTLKVPGVPVSPVTSDVSYEEAGKALATLLAFVKARL